MAGQMKDSVALNWMRRHPEKIGFAAATVALSTYLAHGFMTPPDETPSQVHRLAADVRATCANPRVKAGPGEHSVDPPHLWCVEARPMDAYAATRVTWVDKPDKEVRKNVLRSPRVTVTDVKLREANLAWTVDDGNVDPAGFAVERRAGDGAWAVVATLGPKALAYTDAALEPRTSYAWRVRAIAKTQGVADRTSADVAARTPTPYRIAFEGVMQVGALVSVRVHVWKDGAPDIRLQHAAGDWIGDAKYDTLCRILAIEKVTVQRPRKRCRTVRDADSKYIRCDPDDDTLPVATWRIDLEDEGVKRSQHADNVSTLDQRCDRHRGK
jgi:hypothetical protein